MTQRALNNMVSSDHPAKNPVANALREVEIVAAVTWCLGTTYKVHFIESATTEQIEALLDAIEAACGLTPTDAQPKGRTVWIHREWVNIEIE